VHRIPCCTAGKNIRVGGHLNKDLIRAPAGRLPFATDFLVHDSGEPDRIDPRAEQHPLEELPVDVLVYLLGSRYCETNRPGDAGLNQGKARRSRRSAASSLPLERSSTTAAAILHQLRKFFEIVLITIGREVDRARHPLQ
jgi:hypothetical protein